MKRTMLVTGAGVLATLSAMVLSACAGPGSDPSDPGSLRAAYAGSWVTGETYMTPDEPFLELSADGTLTGSDGCNGAQSTWDVDADGVPSVEAFMTTEMWCPGAPLPTLFSTATSIAVSGGELVLTVDGEQHTLVAAPSGEGSATDAEGVAGTWGTDADGEPSLSLSEDGTLSGTDGCNRLTGSWSIENGAVTVGDGVASTMMLCDGVDTWLSGISGAKLSGDGSALVVFDDEGVRIGELSR